MEREEIGKFYAITFDYKAYEFIVYDDCTMDCPMLGLKDITRIELKPRFVLSGKYFGTYTYDSDKGITGDASLIANYQMDEDLFDYLKQRGMIRYSTDMAYLYGFSDKRGYDSYPRTWRTGCAGSPYKWAKKKGPILVKQRNGQFN